MDTAAQIVTEAVRLWREECLSISEAYQQASKAIPASEGARRRASTLVFPAVSRLRRKREAAILALAKRLGGGRGLAESIDAWVEAHRVLKRARARGIQVVIDQCLAVIRDLEAEIASHLSPEVWRQFSTSLEV